jgi:type I restriction enzyme S subunit
MLKIPAATNQACAAILPGDKVDQAFLFEMLKMQYERLRAMGRGGNQANLNLGMIKALDVPCPPMDAQARFVAHVTALESIRTQQEVASQRSLSTFEALLSKLLFERERRPNDESLEVAVA